MTKLDNSFYNKVNTYHERLVQWENTSLTGMGSGVRIPHRSYQSRFLINKRAAFLFCLTNQCYIKS
ncbi:hypothetical protein EMIT0180MI3_20147 [Priestia megaterium]